ncbi:MAG TPA: two-component regulator propeller domain-containing protein, partial [Dokdonella sp.]
MRLGAGLLFACAIATSASPAGAEAVRRDFYFQTLDAERGLAQNTVTAMLQDRSGFVWIGNAAGLQQYDGYGFSTYEHAADDPNSLPEGAISALAEDGRGDLWIGTSSHGLVRRGAADGRFRRVAIGGAGAPDGLAGTYSLQFDAHRGGLWVGTDAGVALVEPSSGRLLRLLPLAGANAPAPTPRKLRLADDGSLWVASPAGLLRLAPQDDAFGRVAADAIDDVYDLAIGNDRQLLAATAHGVFRVRDDGAAEHVWPEQGGGPVTAVAEDARGRLWIAVPREGIAVFDPADRQTQ